MNDRPQRCATCVLSSSFPKIAFDENGICGFCRNESFITTDDQAIARAKNKIAQLIAANKGAASHDAVMCYSGGKDSTYTLMKAVQKYGMKVLAFTFDNGFISSAAQDNIQRIVDHLGVDLITIRPSAKFFVPLIKASALHQIYNPKTLVRISAVCNSCISMVNLNALKIALEKQIPLILAGFTLGQIPANTIVYQNNYKFFQESREPVLARLRALLGPDVDEYLRISEPLLDRVKSYPYNINLLCIEDPSEDEIFAEIGKLGWKSPKDVDGCSSNCRLNGFNNYVHLKQFGYSPYELELSHLIRKGKLKKEEAEKKLSAGLEPTALKEIMTLLCVADNEIPRFF